MRVSRHLLVVIFVTLTQVLQILIIILYIASTDHAKVDYILLLLQYYRCIYM